MPLTLPEELTIYAVGELKSAWLSWLDAPDAGTGAVDAGAVAEVDAAGVQLLLSLSRSLAERQRRLTLAPCSPALVQALHTLGAAHLIENPGAVA